RGDGGRGPGSATGGIVDAALTQRLAPGKDESRQGKPPLERTDGAYAAGSDKAVVLIALCAEHDRRVPVGIAESANRRQQCRVPRRGGEKGVAQRPDRASRQTVDVC